MKDKLGNSINIGSYIVYGHNLGRCAGLRIGRILDIKGKLEKYSSTGELKFHFTVIGIDDDYFNPNSNSNKITLLSKKSTLQFNDRIIVLDKLPKEYKDLLDNYKWW